MVQPSLTSFTRGGIDVDISRAVMSGYRVREVA